MSLPMLFGGADCGPSNPLQGLSKRFDQDRGIQQDHFNSSRAGSSRNTFRSQTSSTGPDADAASFFSSSTPAMATPGPSTAFDVSTMRAALPPTSVQTPQLQVPVPTTHTPAAAAGWAADFMNMGADLGVIQQQQKSQMASPGQASMMQQQDGNLRLVHSPPSLMQNWTPAGFDVRGFIPHMPLQQQQQRGASASLFHDQISWDEEFTAQETSLATSIAEQHVAEVQQEAQKTSFEGDELARTAGLLLDNLKHETNPKFQKSMFMELMKQLRDGEMVVDGNQVVENDGRMRNSEQINAADVKGKGKEKEYVTTGGFLPTTSSLVQNQQGRELQGREEDPNDIYFQQENADYVKYWNQLNSGGQSDTAHTVQQREWDTLQEDWDRFEATSTGIKELVNYQFQENNPYMLGDSSQARHQVGISVLESVLELEAAVQKDMTNAKAWYELGVKQQENEREHKALQALLRAVELDPTHLPSWLALAISYTNDNNRQGTYDAVSEWVKRNARYTGVNAGLREAATPPESMTMSEKYGHLVDRLIAMALSETSGQVDADIQIALAVLLNTNEEYEKAQDCFKTALAVRPDDWLLYNRVGATMANSGHAQEALQYYYRALEMNPGYIRARFNLGISCINLRRYEEAAHHILDALVLQDSDGIKDVNGNNETRGVTSTALWDSLKTTCLQMQRADLAGLCDVKDLEKFRTLFRG